MQHPESLILKIFLSHPLRNTAGLSQRFWDLCCSLCLRMLDFIRYCRKLTWSNQSIWTDCISHIFTISSSFMQASVKTLSATEKASDRYDDVSVATEGSRDRKLPSTETKHESGTEAVLWFKWRRKASHSYSVLIHILLTHVLLQAGNLQQLETLNPHWDESVSSPPSLPRRRWMMLFGLSSNSFTGQSSFQHPSTLSWKEALNISLQLLITCNELLWKCVFFSPHSLRGNW